MFYIAIEDVAANALIQALSKNEKKRFLTYMTIEAYGNRVVEKLNEENKKAILIFSRNRTAALYRNYSHFFEPYEENGQRGIRLREGITLENLIIAFQGYLALDLLKAFMDVSVEDSEVA
ncbi:hypothetical protein [Mitsuokella sp. oral taxon 131]|uniref:hypothetical protein n=1 Tax=Mitsuokella sp. oral taxon 131 TaxID=1321780 RepID=UPI0003AE15D0|nr:hypothetical protein [Mitsuokella sp. oral taxon 131]ERL03716.1 hypothetical protein HMPREF1985_01950 [Mitsuokella sp. oral taxon 131 str. W9106]